MMTDPYGFYWHGIAVQRTAEIARGKKGTWHVLSITTERGTSQKLEIYVSPTGFTRVFKDHKELR